MAEFVVDGCVLHVHSSIHVARETTQLTEIN